MGRDRGVSKVDTKDKARRTLREAWPAWRETLFITGSLLVSTAVAAVTGWGSWAHIVHIGVSVGEPVAAWLPVAIDGMMVNGTILIALDHFRKRVARPWAVISLWLGSVFTLAFNLASAWERGWAAMVIAVMFSVALLCTVEAIFHPSKVTIVEAMERRAARRKARMEPAAPVIPDAPIAVSEPVADPIPVEIVMLPPVPMVPTSAETTAPVKVARKAATAKAPKATPTEPSKPRAPRRRSATTATGPGTGSPRRRKNSPTPEAESGSEAETIGDAVMEASNTLVPDPAARPRPEDVMPALHAQARRLNLVPSVNGK